MKTIKLYVGLAAVTTFMLTSGNGFSQGTMKKDSTNMGPNGRHPVNSTSKGSYTNGSTWNQTNDSTDRLKKSRTGTQKGGTNNMNSVGKDSAGYRRTPK